MNVKCFKIVVAVLLFPLWGTLHAESQYEFVLKPGSQLWLEGDSTLHAYEARAKELKISGAAKITGDLQPWADTLEEVVALPEISGFVLRVPVENLVSDSGGLTRRMHRTLNKEEYPEIVFNMSSYSSRKVEGEEGKYVISSTGTLLVSGVENRINLNPLVEVTTGHIRVTGEKELLMTDYGMKPPVMALVLRTRDEVDVKWNLEIGIEKVKGDEKMREEKDETGEGKEGSEEGGVE